MSTWVPGVPYLQWRSLQGKSCSSCISSAYAQPCLQTRSKRLRKEHVQPHTRHQQDYYDHCSGQRSGLQLPAGLPFSSSGASPTPQNRHHCHFQQHEGRVLRLPPRILWCAPSHFPSLGLSPVKWEPLLLIYPQAREHLSMQGFKTVTGQRQ